MSGLKIRTFRRGDLALEGIAPDEAERTPAWGWSFERADGTLVGYSGVRTIGATAWMFFYGLEGVRRPIWVHRHALRWLDAAEAMGITPLHALCDTSYPRAVEWLTALRFKPTGDVVDGKGVWIR